MAGRPGEGRLVAALLLVTAATGLLDAVSLLHLGTFTGYMTGTVILLGVHLADRATWVGPGVIALAAYLAGALLGGRLVRRHDRAAPRLIGDVLLGVAVLIGAAAALEGEAAGSAASAWWRCWGWRWGCRPRRRATRACRTWPWRQRR